MGDSGMFLIRRALRSKGILNGVTARSVGCAAGMSFKSVVVYPVERAHYSLVYDTTQTVHRFLPPCYFFQREKQSVDTSIIYDWAAEFLEERKHPRQNSAKLLLILDSYGV